MQQNADRVEEKRLIIYKQLVFSPCFAEGYLQCKRNIFHDHEENCEISMRQIQNVCILKVQFSSIKINLVTRKINEELLYPPIWSFIWDHGYQVIWLTSPKFWQTCFSKVLVTRSRNFNIIRTLRVGFVHRQYTGWYTKTERFSIP